MPVHRFFIGGKIGVGVGLPYGSPFPGLGAELDVTKNLALLVGGTKLAGWIGAMGVRFYARAPERRLRPHLSAHVWPGGYGAYAGVDYDFGASRGIVTTCGLGGFGDINLDNGVVDGLSLLLGLGYKF